MQGFKKIKREELISSLKNNTFPTYLDDELKLGFENAVINNDFLLSRNILLYAIYRNKVKVLKKKGLLRITKYLDNSKATLSNILEDTISEFENLSLSSADKQYLYSLFHFSKLQSDLVRFNKDISKAFINFNRYYEYGSFIPTLMAWIDHKFLTLYLPTYSEDSLYNFTKEELCEAISFLIYKYTNFGFKHNPLRYKTEVSFLGSKEFLDLLNNACIFNDLKEKEIQLELDLYECVTENDTVVFRSIDENIEKTIRIGYIRTDLHKYNQTVQIAEYAQDHHIVSLVECIKGLYEEIGYKFYNKVDNFDYVRYNLVITEELNQLLIDKYIARDGNYLEEVAYLGYIDTDHITASDSLVEMKIRKNLSIERFLKINRLFRLHFYLFSFHLIDNEDLENVLRSLIPYMTFENLRKISSGYFSDDEIDEFVEIISWSQESDEKLDLQYTPAIIQQKGIYFSPTLISESNHIRNLYSSEYSRNNTLFFSNGENDSIIKKLCKSFESKGYQVYADIEIKSTDIDVLAVVDDTVFIFECKNTLHPVNWFDLRRTYQNILKAESQLNKIKKFTESGKLKELLKSLSGINIENMNFEYAIITSTRVLNGNWITEYPIRNINEMISHINSGIVRTNEKEYKVWEGSNFKSSDLIYYLSKNNITYKTFFESLNKIATTKQFYQHKIVTETYELSDENTVNKILMANIENKFKK